MRNRVSSRRASAYSFTREDDGGRRKRNRQYPDSLGRFEATRRDGNLEDQLALKVDIKIGIEPRCT